MFDHFTLFGELEEEVERFGIREEDYMLMMMMMYKKVSLLTRERDQIKQKRNDEEKLSPLMGIVFCFYCQ